MQAGEMNLTEKLVDCVDRLIGIVAKLLRITHCPRAASLSSTLVTEGSGIFIVRTKNNFMAQTITVLAGQNTVTQQLTPIGADGVTVEPITTINAGSEIYTVTPTGIATATALIGGAEGLYTVNRVAGQAGTVVVTYTAVNTAGTLITNTNGVGDTYIFQGPLTGLAASLASAQVSIN